jgi:TonB family protein
VRTILILCAALLSCSSALAQENAPAPAQSDKSKPSANAFLGVQMLTPDQGVDFNSYLANVYREVKRSWFSRMPDSVIHGEKGRVAIRFQIQKDGTLSSHAAIIETSSGKKSLDEAALNGVRDSAPFTKLLESFSGPYIEVRASFFYNMPLPPGPLRKQRGLSTQSYTRLGAD